MTAPRLRKALSSLVYCSGLAVIGVIAIPAGILFAVMFFVWKGVDLVIEKIEKG